jgi:hypothetical protein
MDGEACAKSLDELAKRRKLLAEEQEKLEQDEDAAMSSLRAELFQLGLQAAEQKTRILQLEGEVASSKERDVEWSKVRDKAQEISSSKVFALSIGGERFEVSSMTLLSQWAEGSIFPSLFAEGKLGQVMSAGPRTSDGAILIDRDGKAFRWILNFLRDCPECTLPQSTCELLALRKEAEYFGLEGLSQKIKPLLQTLLVLLAIGDIKIEGRHAWHPRKQGYYGIQFDVEVPREFEFHVRVNGKWGRYDSFLIGVATREQWASFVLGVQQPHRNVSMSGYGGKGDITLRVPAITPAEIGYFFAPHSGRLLAMDGSTGAVPSLYGEVEDHSICRSPIGLAPGTYHFAEGHSWGFTFDGDRMQLSHLSDTGSETNLGVAQFKTGADSQRGGPDEQARHRPGA